MAYNFRVIPEQNQVLVVRNIEKLPDLNMESSHTSIELYAIPLLGQKTTAEAVDFRILDKEDYINVQISEMYRKMPTHEDDSITPYLSQDHIQPISVYLRSELSMIHYALYPYSVDPPPSPPDTPSSQTKATDKGGLVKTPQRKFIYDLTRSVNLDFTVDDDDKESEAEEEPEFETKEERLAAERGEWIFPVKAKKDDALRFLPGSSRGVFYQIPRFYQSIDPPVTGIFAYQINEKDRGFFDYVAHMPLDDALVYADTLNIYNEDYVEELNDEQREEMEVAHALAPEGRKKDGYIHPSLKIPSRKIEDGRKGMTIMDLSDDFKTLIAYGVHAMCFDEDVGRLVVATKADRKLHVFDFAHKREKGKLPSFFRLYFVPHLTSPRCRHRRYQSDKRHGRRHGIRDGPCPFLILIFAMCGCTHSFSVRVSDHQTMRLKAFRCI